MSYRKQILEIIATTGKANKSCHTQFLVEGTKNIFCRTIFHKYFSFLWNTENFIFTIHQEEALILMHLSSEASTLESLTDGEAALYPFSDHSPSFSVLILLTFSSLVVSPPSHLLDNVIMFSCPSCSAPFPHPVSLCLVYKHKHAQLLVVFCP